MWRFCKLKSAGFCMKKYAAKGYKAFAAEPYVVYTVRLKNAAVDEVTRSLFKENGGAEGSRTLDLLGASEAL